MRKFLVSLTLPEWNKNDGLDSEEFEHGLKRLQEVSRGKIEEQVAVQGKRHWDIVDDGDVQVSAFGTVNRKCEF